MSEPKPDELEWSIESARDLYQIGRWGAGYFDINTEGNVFAQPDPNQTLKVDLKKIIEEAHERNLRFPLLIRFQDILRHRVNVINKAFQAAIHDSDYKGQYRGVFPIKVNQLREVVEEVLKAGAPFKTGLEVGSKPELFAALALQTTPGSLLICNGYKDPSFIRMALMGIKLGKRVIMVIEKLEELGQIIKVSRETGVRPIIGIRARLLSKGAGKWADSSGETAKFGLGTAELITAADRLVAEKMEDCFQLLHFHIGSQIPDIQSIKRATQEATRIYSQLHKMGFDIQTIDVGGGLAVDYDGSATACNSSTNYTLQEYANDIVYHIGQVCDAEKVPHPEITSESGRAIVAHHSILVVDVFGSIEKGAPNCRFTYGPDEHNIVKELLEIREQLPELNQLEAFHDAMEHKDEAHHMFNLGILNLREKAKIESLAWEICRAVQKSFSTKDFVPEEIRALEGEMGDQYLCNFSVFQSLLDHWACDQLFPIMPVCRLNEEPTRETTLADITCDSDGNIDQFIDLEATKETLRLHELVTHDEKIEPYYLGLFLMGAYQDIMGDLHNLFGRVNEVHIFLDSDEPSGYYIEEIIPGNTIQASLNAVQYDEKELGRQMKAQVEAAIVEDRLKPSEGMQLLGEYNAGLTEYTYLSF